MRLYFNKYTRATRPRWLIEETGLACEIVNVDLAAGEHKRPEFLAVHPLGKVPALRDGDTTIMESGAITLYLADRTDLAPAPNSAARAVYYQWAFYAVTQLEGPVGRYFQEQRKPEGERDEATLRAARAELDAMCAPIARALDGQDWLVDGRFTAADVLVGSILAWARAMGILPSDETLGAYVERCATRPAFKRARA
jgi:glutathione S-transferase